jgi:hypothetical protein
MHHFYAMIAADIARDRMREAAQWRLADAARQPQAPGSRIRRLGDFLSGLAGQASRAALRPGAVDCR